MVVFRTEYQAAYSGYLSDKQLAAAVYLQTAFNYKYRNAKYSPLFFRFTQNLVILRCCFAGNGKEM